MDAADRVRRPSSAPLALAVATAGKFLMTLVAQADLTKSREHCGVYKQASQSFVEEAAFPATTFFLAGVADGRQSYPTIRSSNTELRCPACPTFLTEVSTPQDLPVVLTMVLLNRPEYRAVLDGLVEFRRSVAVHLEDAALDAPLQNLPYLYQRWCLLEVIDTMTRVAAGQGYRVAEERLSRRRRGALFIDVLPMEEPLVRYRHDESGTEATLTHERTFDGKSSPWSVSFAQRPDIVIEVQARNSAPRLFVFDPKYKLDSEDHDEEGWVGRPKKSDIDKMHAYRDAIRGDGGRQVVDYAAILYPGPNQHYGDNLAALQAVGGCEARLRTELDEVLTNALTTIAR